MTCRAQALGNFPFYEGEYNDINRYGGQAQLRWLAADDLTLDLNYNYGKTDQAARGQNCQVVTDIPGTGWQATFRIPSSLTVHRVNITDWCQRNQDLGKDKIMANLEPNQYKAEVNTLALTVDWEISDVLNFKSISAARSAEGGEVNELDAIGIALLGRTNFAGNGAEQRNTDSYSQEFQLLGSAFDDKLDYVVGAFGFTEKTDKGAATSPSLFFNALLSPNLLFIKAI